MPNAELSDRVCDHCGKLGALLQCGRCKQVAYCNFTCQRTGWKAHKLACVCKTVRHEDDDKRPVIEDASTPEVQGPPREEALQPPTSQSCPERLDVTSGGSSSSTWKDPAPWLAFPAMHAPIPRPTVLKSQDFAEKVREFLKRNDSLAGLPSSMSRPPKPERKPDTHDRLNYSRWDHIGDSDEEEEKKRRQDMAEQAMKAKEIIEARPSPAKLPHAAKEAPPGLSNAPKPSTNVSKQRQNTREVASLKDVEKTLDGIASEVVQESGHLGYGSEWVLRPPAEDVVRRCLRILNSEVLVAVPEDPCAFFLHGSANYLLRRAVGTGESEKRHFRSAARTSLLKVCKAPGLDASYRLNANDFLAALFDEDGDVERCTEMLSEAAALCGSTVSAPAETKGQSCGFLLRREVVT